MSFNVWSKHAKVIYCVYTQDAHSLTGAEIKKIKIGNEKVNLQEKVKLNSFKVHLKS